MNSLSLGTVSCKVGLLLSIIKKDYTVRTTAKSVVGTLTPEPHKAYSCLIDKVTFFVSEMNRCVRSPSLWVLYGTEALQNVEGRHLCGTGQPVVGCEKPVQRPPYSILTDVLGIQTTHTKVLIMSNDNATQDPIYALAKRIQATLALLASDASTQTQFSISHNLITHILNGLCDDVEELLCLIFDQLEPKVIGGAS